MVAQYMPTISFQVLFCVGKKKQNKLTSACNLWPNGSNVLANQSTCFSIVFSEIKLVYKTFLLLLVSKHASMAYFSGCQWLLVLMTIITNCRLSQDQLTNHFQSNRNFQNFTSGMFGGFCAAAIVTPGDRIKCLLQVT